MNDTRDPELEWALAGDGEFAVDPEGEFATLGDGEFEDEQFLGPALLRGLGGLLGGGSGDGEFALDPERDPFGEPEDEGEGEPFLPALLPIAKVALPLISSLFGGGRRRRRRARESEWEAEDPEFQLDGEFEDEQFLGGLIQGVGNLLGLGEGEAEGPAAAGPALAEVLAAAAAESESEAEAEAMIGAATVLALTARERRALRRLIPQLVQTAALLTRLLRRRRRTRTVVRVIPAVMRGSARPLTARVAAGQPLSRSVASRVVRGQVQRVLTRPPVARAAMRRNVVITRRMTGSPVVYRRTYIR